MIKTTISRSALAIAILGSGTAQMAAAKTAGQPQADEAESATEGEIIVTALKREQSLQDVPVSIDVVSADTIAERNVSSASQ